MKPPIIRSDETLQTMSESQFKIIVQILIEQIEKAGDRFVDMVYHNDYIKPSDYADKVDLIAANIDLAVIQLKCVIHEDDWSKAFDAINKAIESKE